MRMLKSDVFDDPVYKVKSTNGKCKAAGRSRTVRFGIPLYGLGGMAFNLSWLVLMTATPSMYPWSHFSNCEGVAVRGMFLAAMAFACLLAFLLSRFCPSKVDLCLTAVVFVLSPTACLTSFVDVSFGLSLVGWALTGTASGSMLMLWGRHISAFANQRQVMMALTGTCLCGSVVSLTGFLFRENIAIIFIVALPYLSLAMFRFATPRTKKRARDLSENPSEQIDRRRFLLKEFMPSAVCMVALGYYVFDSAIQQQATTMFVVNTLALFLAGLCMLIVLFRLPSNPAYLILGLVLPLSAVFIFLATIGPDIVRIASVGIIVFIQTCVVLVHFANVARNSKHLFVDYAKSVCIFGFCDTVALSLGWTVSVVQQSIGSDTVSASHVSALALLCIMAVVIPLCLFTSTPSSKHVAHFGSVSCKQRGVWTIVRDTPETSVSSSKDDELLVVPEEAEARLKDTVDRLAVDFNLSRRETEVLACLARGHNAQSVSRKLNVSANTAKTHIHNIYAKFDVHSRQELVDYIELVHSTGEHRGNL